MEGYGQASNAVVPNVPAQDSLVTLFTRIGLLVDTIADNTSAIEKVGDILIGASLEGAAKVGDAPSPSHVLWRARDIEIRLNTIVERQNIALKRIDQAIG